MSARRHAAMILLAAGGPGTTPNARQAGPQASTPQTRGSQIRAGGRGPGGGAGDGLRARA
jgi:hypothetical protein